jgi:predicted N-acyltransferase
MRDFQESEWDALLAPEFVPHMRWTFLDVLEQTGCVKPEVGWLPQHLSLHRDGKLIAVAPAYVKGNSEGEFVFDHSWARFCQESLRLDYFPKLILAVPFTPATGPRLLTAGETDPVEMHLALAQGLERFIGSARLSSAHVLFLPDASARSFESAGLSRRFGVQYHWHNAGYRSFDDFLARFNAKRRHQIRRERRELLLAGIELSALSGKELGTELIDHVYEFYVSTVDKHFYGRRYLNRAFFHEICARMPENVLVVLAREKGARRPLACAFNLVSQRAMFGRYWGAREDRPFLHFNVCYYEGIDQCIQRGLDYFEPGAGGEHKHVRGFESSLTHSVHYLRDPRLRGPVDQFLSQERAAILEHLATEKPLFKVPELG